MFAPKKTLKKIHSELPSKCKFFSLSFGLIWPSLVQIFGPDDSKISKIKFLDTWNHL